MLSEATAFAKKRTDELGRIGNQRAIKAFEKSAFSKPYQSAMDLLSLDYAKEVQYIPFTDMDADTENAEYIISAYNIGIISGYEDGTFNPEGTINRAEALKIIFNIVGDDITPLTGRPLLEYYDLPSNPFPDVDIDAWYAPYVIYAYMNGIVSGYGDGYFRPDNQITLGEMAKIVTLVMTMQ